MMLIADMVDTSHQSWITDIVYSHDRGVRGRCRRRYSRSERRELEMGRTGHDPCFLGYRAHDRWRVRRHHLPRHQICRPGPKG